MAKKFNVMSLFEPPRIRRRITLNTPTEGLNEAELMGLAMLRYIDQSSPEEKQNLRDNIAARKGKA